jgi:hypothetical protein
MEAVWAQISTAEKRAAYAHARGQVRVEIDEEQQTTTDPLATAAARRYEQAQTGSRPRETVSAIA